MNVFKSFAAGLKTTGRIPQMIVLLFLINFLFSLTAAVPLYKSLRDSLGRSEAGDRMAKGFDYLWWEEFRDESTGLAATFSPDIIGKGALLNNLEGLVEMKFLKFPPSLLAVGILSLILHTFLAGGILTCYTQDRPFFSMKTFFEGAGKYFLRFILITLISWVLFYAVISLQSALSSIRDTIAENALTEVSPFLFWLFACAVIYFLLMFIQMLFDYIRIDVVTAGRKNILASTACGLKFVFRHIGSGLGLYYLLFAVSVSLAVVYVLIKTSVPQSTLGGVIAAFIIQQAFILAVIWVRCWLYSSQLSLYRQLS